MRRIKSRNSPRSLDLINGAVLKRCCTEEEEALSQSVTRSVTRPTSECNDFVCYDDDDLGFMMCDFFVCPTSLKF